MSSEALGYAINPEASAHYRSVQQAIAIIEGFSSAVSDELFQYAIMLKDCGDAREYPRFKSRGDTTACRTLQFALGGGPDTQPHTQ